MPIQFKEITAPDLTSYKRQTGVRRRSERAGNMRYENVLLAADQDAD